MAVVGGRDAVSAPSPPPARTDLVENLTRSILASPFPAPLALRARCSERGTSRKVRPSLRVESRRSSRGRGFEGFRKPESRREPTRRRFRKAPDPSCKVDRNAQKVTVARCKVDRIAFGPPCTACGGVKNARIPCAQRSERCRGVSDPHDTSCNVAPNAFDPRCTTCRGVENRFDPLHTMMQTCSDAFDPRCTTCWRTFENSRPSATA